jgi:histidinol phosphatase-like PHP family hydrolase
MKYGVEVARRGWAEKKDIINSWSQDRLMKWLAK